MCYATHISINQEHFILDLLTIPLGGFDIVLGVQWLHSLGPIVWDFSLLTMRYQRQGQITWRGVAPAQPALHLHSVSAIGELMAKLLTEFSPVFDEPRGLPPPRSHDHRIHLLLGINAVVVRPYRYPTTQKDELERQCAAMLEKGIIRRSSSAFSAPVLLVKKDGSWRFCVDYRTLNDKTVKDKFPIPMDKELLDELKGARFFTKLDLCSGYHQVRMAPDDVEKTAFHTHEGLFEFFFCYGFRTNQ